jgi:glycosyltransferase involved in cell wall biosynthesis
VFFVNRFFHPDHSATSQLLSDLAFALAAAGPDRMTVITSRQLYDQPDADMSPQEEIAGVTVVRVRSTRFGRGRLMGRAVDYFSFYLGATATLLRLARRGDVIVAKTDPPLISVCAALVAWVKGARLVNWLQDLFPEVASALEVRGSRFIEPWLKAVRNLSLRLARRNVALGELMAQRLMGEGVAGEKVVVIPNWADGAALRPVPREENRLRREWGLEGRFVVAYSGNFGRAHEFGTLLAAARALKDDERFAFLFIGGGAQQRQLEAAVRAEGLANVLFKPYQPRELLAQSLSAADVHVISLLPCLEGLIVPSKFYGIAAVGRPTLFIGDPAGELGRLLTAHDCGFALPIGDSAGVVVALQRLCAEPALAARMGASARALLEARFDRPIALAAWRELLSGVAA